MKQLLRKSLSLLLASVMLLLSACTILRDGYGTPASSGAAGTESSPEPTAAPTGEDAGKLAVSELMVRNNATVQDADGDFPDYIELQNRSGGTLSTAGWSLADGEDGAPWLLPEVTLQPDELLLIFASGKDRREGEYHAAFSLSRDEMLLLRTPSGYVSESIPLTEDSRDTALVRGEDGSFSATRLSSPGYPNGRDGYLAFLAARHTDSPVVIQEVMVSNQSYAKQSELGYSDWVELKNVSDETVDLSGYTLSDGEIDYSLAAAGSLEAGRTLLVYCDKEAADCLNTGFGLSPNSDRIYLKRGEAVVDYLYLHDIPVDGSYGRVSGEDGFFYFTVPTPNEDNSSLAYRFVSETPEGTRDGVYDGVESVTVELSAPGTIFYTTDGTVPTSNSPVYTGPFEIDATTIVRAVAVEDGAAHSRVLTLSYILNAGHDIPVLSLVADNLADFESMYRTGYIDERIPCVLSLYEEGGSFSQAGGLGLAGAGTRTKYPKKSLSIKFSGKYGDGDLKYDLFGTDIQEYDAVTLHVGEDYCFTMFRTDLFQDLALAMGGNAVAQHTKFCALYVNGTYYGIYGLKERWTEKFYADLMGVSEESVEILKYPVELNSSFYLEVIQFCRENDLSVPENYQHFCEMVNIDSLIDWFLLEGLAGNPDIGGNMRVMRTTEGADTRWRFAIYDLDWSMRNTDSVFTTFFNNNDYHYGQIYAILSAAWKNPDFMDAMLTRYAEVWNTTLSNDNIVAMIDAMAEEIRSEMPRERAVWGGDTNGVDNWERNVSILRSYILDNDLQTLGVRNLCRVLGISDAVRAKYFGW